jgi:hypothetical protein
VAGSFFPAADAFLLQKNEKRADCVATVHGVSVFGVCALSQTWRQTVADVEDEYGDGDDYRPSEQIQMFELVDGLRSLHMLAGDLFLGMQATNLALVDQFIMELEDEVRAKLFAEERTPSETFFLSAQTQMWIFAAYELLRTWKERAAEVLKLAKNGGLELKIKALERDRGYRHFGHEEYATQLKAVLSDSTLLDKIREDQRVVYFPFSTLEHLRVALAKHQVVGQPNVAAYAPGYGRINQWCGALDYQLEADGMIFGTVNRRSIADSIRALTDRSNVPTEEEIAEHRKVMKGLRRSAFPENK